MPATVLVTGATDGIGRQTASTLAKLGHTVLVHGRRPDRVAAVVREITQAGGTAEGVVFDLASFAAVRQGADEVARRFPDLSVLLNNAGVFASRLETTADGHELTWQVNHLAPYLLSRLLLPTLQRNAPARLVFVSSGAHAGGRIAWDAPDASAGYEAYAQSKLANLLTVLAFAKRLDAHEVTVNGLHPGVVATKLLREGFGSQGRESLEEGAETSVHLAAAPEVAGVTGQYFVRSRPAEPSPQARSAADAERLWSLSARAVGLPE